MSATYLMQSSQRYMIASLPRRCSWTRCSLLRVWQLWQYIDCPFVVVLIVKYLPHRYKHPCRAARSATVWMRANPSPADARSHAVDAAFLSRLARVAIWAQAVADIAICRYMPDRLYMVALDVGFYRLDLARRHRDDVGTASAALAALAADGVVGIWAHQDVLYRAASKMFSLHVCHLLKWDFFVWDIGAKGLVLLAARDGSRGLAEAARRWCRRSRILAAVEKLEVLCDDFGHIAL